MLSCGGDSVISRKLWICDQLSQCCVASSSYFIQSNKQLQNTAKLLPRALKSYPVQNQKRCAASQKRFKIAVQRIGSQ